MKKNNGSVLKKLFIKGGKFNEREKFSEKVNNSINVGRKFNFCTGERRGNF